MANALSVVRLTMEGQTPKASVTSTERFPVASYGRGTTDAVRCRYPDLIDVDLD